MSDMEDTSLSSLLYRYRYDFFFGIIAMVSCINLTIDVMEIDAAQYADISMEMSKTGQFLQVMMRGQDYLDKPPLLFWLTSLSISLLGNTNVGYKIIPVLFLLSSFIATYLVAKEWYDKRTGIIAALMLGTTQAFHLMTNDIRTDGLLTSFIIWSIFLLSKYLKQKKITFLLMSGLCIGGAMLAKGPLGMFIPAAAILGHLLLTSQWKKIFNPGWVLLLIPVVLVLAPMCYGLYMQYDLHPEKEVYDIKGPSGLLFYFWTQSFGRISGASTWHNNAPWYYFSQTIIWDLQPWLLLFLPALFFKIASWWKSKKESRVNAEWITLSGFIIPFIALSASNYKLPHYIYPIFPFAAIMTADFLNRFAQRLPAWLDYIQIFIIHALIGLAVLIIFFIFPVHAPWLVILLCIFYFLFWWWRMKAADPVDRWLFPSLSGVLIFQLIMSLHFYPSLLKYESPAQVGKYVAREKPDHMYWHDSFGYSLDYYSGYTVPTISIEQLDTVKAGSWIFIPSEVLGRLPPYKLIRTFDDFHVSGLTMPFLNPKTRASKLKKTCLVEILPR